MRGAGSGRRRALREGADDTILRAQSGDAIPQAAWVDRPLPLNDDSGGADDKIHRAPRHGLQVLPGRGRLPRPLPVSPVVDGAPAPYREPVSIVYGHLKVPQARIAGVGRGPLRPVPHEAKLSKREELSFHSCRHTTGSWLSMQDVPLRVISEILGHSNIKVTEMRNQLSPEVMDRAMEETFGGAESLSQHSPTFPHNSPTTFRFDTLFCASLQNRGDEPRQKTPPESPSAGVQAGFDSARERTRTSTAMGGHVTLNHAHFWVCSG